MKRNFRLTRARDFNIIKKEGSSRRNKLAVLIYLNNGRDTSRSAIVTSKSVGNAVTRNLVKRRMRACIANAWSEIELGWDLVFYARTAVTSASYQELKRAIYQLLEQAGLIIDQQSNVN